MKLFSVICEGNTRVIELNWLVLPTFIGMNQLVRAELGNVIMRKCEFLKHGQLTEELLDEMDKIAINFFQEKFNITGLGTYLDAIKYLELIDETDSREGGAKEESGD